MPTAVTSPKKAEAYRCLGPNESHAQDPCRAIAPVGLLLRIADLSRIATH